MKIESEPGKFASQIYAQLRVKSRNPAYLRVIAFREIRVSNIKSHLTHTVDVSKVIQLMFRSHFYIKIWRI